MTQTINVRALQMMEKRMEEEIVRREYALGQGAAASFEDYRQRVGMIQAFQMVKQMCLEIENELYGREAQR